MLYLLWPNYHPNGSLNISISLYSSLLFLVTVFVKYANAGQSIYPTTETNSFWFALAAGILFALVFCMLVAIIAYFFPKEYCCCCPRQKTVVEEVKKRKKSKSKRSNQADLEKCIDADHIRPDSKRSDKNSSSPSSVASSATSTLDIRGKSSNRDQQNKETDSSIASMSKGSKGPNKEWHGLHSSTQRYQYEQVAKQREYEENAEVIEQFNDMIDGPVMYQCQGLAGKGELEVTNPMFKVNEYNDEESPSPSSSPNRH